MLLAEQLAAVGKLIDDDDLIFYITSGLNQVFNSFNTSISLASHNNSISFDAFQAELFSYELLLENQT